jgi:hypothetical protein
VSDQRRRGSVTQRGQRNVFVRVKAGKVVTGAAWTEVTLHAVERFCERCVPEGVVETTLARLGREARYFGEVPGGMGFVHDEYPQAVFIVRDRPRVLISVMDRSVRRGMEAAKADHDEISNGAVAALPSGALAAMVATRSNPWGAHVIKTVLLRRRIERVRTFRVEPTQLTTTLPQGLPWTQMASVLNEWLASFFMFERMAPAEYLLATLWREPRVLLEDGLETLWETQDGLWWHLRTDPRFPRRITLLEIVPPEEA